MPTVSYMYGDIGCVLKEPSPKLSFEEVVRMKFLATLIENTKAMKTGVQDIIIYHQKRQTELNQLLMKHTSEYVALYPRSLG